MKPTATVSQFDNSWQDNLKEVVGRCEWQSTGEWRECESTTWKQSCQYFTMVIHAKENEKATSGGADVCVSVCRVESTTPLAEEIGKNRQLWTCTGIEQFWTTGNGLMDYVNNRI